MLSMTHRLLMSWQVDECVCVCVYIRAPAAGTGVGPEEQLGIFQQTGNFSPVHRSRRPHSIAFR